MTTKLARRLERADIQQLVEGFAERSLSKETRTTYERVLREFLSYLAGAGVDPLEATPDHVRRYRDGLVKEGKRPATVTQRLSIVRTFYRYLKAAGLVTCNPALSELVPAPAVPDEGAGCVLGAKDVRHLLAGPDRNTATGARDFAILLLLARTSLRAAEAAALRTSSIRRNKDLWTVTVTVKGGRQRELPLPDDVKEAIDRYLALDGKRRAAIRGYKTAGEMLQSWQGKDVDRDAPLFQSMARFLDSEEALTVRSVRRIVERWAEFGRVGRPRTGDPKKLTLSPHDLRRTAITRAYDLGMNDRQVQAMSGHRDPRSTQRYDRHRFNLEHNAIRALHYDEE
jgi:integrase/recombinase XerD